RRNRARALIDDLDAHPVAAAAQAQLDAPLAVDEGVGHELARDEQRPLESGGAEGATETLADERARACRRGVTAGEADGPRRTAVVLGHVRLPHAFASDQHLAPGPQLRLAPAIAIAAMAVTNGGSARYDNRNGGIPRSP